MPVRKEPLSTGRDSRLNRRNQMNDRLLTSRIVLMPLRKHIQHYRPRTEIERHVLPEGTARRDQNWSLHAALLDMAVADVRAGEASGDALGVRPQAPITNDSREIDHVRDVVDRSVVHGYSAQTFRAGECGIFDLGLHEPCMWRNLGGNERRYQTGTPLRLCGQLFLNVLTLAPGNWMDLIVAERIQDGARDGLLGVIQYRIDF